MSMSMLMDLIPSSKPNLERLHYLKNNSGLTRIAVFGIYNHGKSTLLNALVGEEIFKAADKRETKEIKVYESSDIIWIDTPGLSADTAEKDDKAAKETVFREADFIFIVHNVQEGELDRTEYNLYHQLMRQDKDCRKKFFMALSQIDQIDQEMLKMVKDRLKNQLPGLRIFPVSATRFLKGLYEEKQKLVELSGIPELISFVEELKKEVKPLRKRELKRLVSKAMIELNEIKTHHSKEVEKFEYEIFSLKKFFLSAFDKMKSSIQQKVKAN